MINGVNNIGAGAISGVQTTTPASTVQTAATTGKNFSDILTTRLEELARLRADIPATTNKNEVAFQTLLSLQSKLLEASKEICAIGI